MPEEPTPSSLLGGLVVEVCLALVLYGIITAQSYIYMLNSKNDLAIIRCIVGSVWLVEVLSQNIHALSLNPRILETLHTIFIIHMLYYYIITSFGNLLAVGDIIWSAGACVLVEMLIVTLVQGFYIRRVFIRTQQAIYLAYCHYWNAPSSPCCVRGWYISALVAAIMTYFDRTWLAFRSSKGPFVTLTCALALSAAVDVAIAVILIYYLKRGQSGFTSTDSVLRALMTYAVNTGAITMIVSICIVLTFIFLKNSLLFAGLITMASKLYANSLLGTLNARKMLREKAGLASTYNDVAELSNLDRDIHSHVISQGKQQQIQIFQSTTKDVQFSPRSPLPDRRSSVKFGTST
ncbi:hypothetical protein QCA50_007235 [Cerrena zonata]|uniref:DUF6534 domain-containing protein n=1 Tax=Cerrena zonata TaxID=2478898 RepID=A0AAW0G7R5_9APHY